MAQKGTRITPEEVVLFNQLYRKYGTYAAVARETGRSAHSVKKYVELDSSYKAAKLVLNQLTQDS